MLQFFTREYIVHQCIQRNKHRGNWKIRAPYRIEDNTIVLRVVLLTGTSIPRSKQGIIARGTIPTLPDLFYN